MQFLSIFVSQYFSPQKTQKSAKKYYISQTIQIYLRFWKYAAWLEFFWLLVYFPDMYRMCEVSSYSLETKPYKRRENMEFSHLADHPAFWRKILLQLSTWSGEFKQLRYHLQSERCTSKSGIFSDMSRIFEVGSNRIYKFYKA